MPSNNKSIKRGGGKSPNTVKRGGGSKHNTVKRGGAKPSNNKAKLVGGSKHNTVKRGGAVRMPSEYYGVESGRYFADGSPELANGESAYGKFIDVSQGVSSLSGMVGPNVASYPNASCTQTGGAKRSKRSKRSKHSKRH